MIMFEQKFITMERVTQAKVNGAAACGANQQIHNLISYIDLFPPVQGSFVGLKKPDFSFIIFVVRYIVGF
jgi:hypothetical protein